MERLRTEAETPVAPHEVRELLTRLTEADIEAMRPDEARTLGGLALETGVSIDRLQEELRVVRGEKPPRTLSWFVPAALLAATIGIGAWALQTPLGPKPQSAPPISIGSERPSYSKAGLVNLDQVTYGPDAGNVMVDPSFEPSTALPKGVSVTASIGDVLWGAGDHRAGVVRSGLSEADAAKLRQTLKELLVHARRTSDRRGLPITPTPSGEPGFAYPGPGYYAQLQIFTYYGVSGVGVPLPPMGVDDADANRLIERAARRAVERLQSQLRWHDRVTRPPGP